MNTQTFIIGTIILAIIIMVYQLFVFKNSQKYKKNGRKHPSDDALELFFNTSPLRSFLYNLFLKDQIQSGKKKYKVLKHDEVEDEV